MKDYKNSTVIAEELGNASTAQNSTEEVINQLIRGELNQFYAHFKDDNVRRILEDFFCSNLAAFDWRAQLEGSTDSRTLARLICASDVLIACSIHSCNTGDFDPVAHCSAKTHAIWSLHDLAQCIRAPLDLKEVLGEPLLTNEEMRQLALMEVDMQGEAVLKAEGRLALRSQILRDL